MKECQIYEHTIIGDHYIGYYRMMFGVRIRAGKLFAQSCDIDICLGNSSYLIDEIKTIYIIRMNVNLSCSEPILTGLLNHPKVKPAFEDIDWLNWFLELRNQCK